MTSVVVVGSLVVVPSVVVGVVVVVVSVVGVVALVSVCFAFFAVSDRDEVIGQDVRDLRRDCVEPRLELVDRQVLLPQRVHLAADLGQHPLPVGIEVETRPPMPSTNWYASTTATHMSQFSSNAIATLVRVTVDGLSSTTTTISNAIATAAQSVQLAYATAPCVRSTTSPSTCRIAKATLNTLVPSFVVDGDCGVVAGASRGRCARREANREERGEDDRQ